MLFLMAMNSNYVILKKTKIFIFLTFFAAHHLIAQTQLIASDVTAFNCDNLGNIYYVDSKNIFYKQPVSSYQKLNFLNNTTGRIGSFDVTNPLKTLIYYPDFFTVKFLDVNLTEINTFNIRDIYISGNIRLVCSSNNNGFWMYDETNRKLIKLGDNFKTLQESADLYQLLGLTPNPVSMLEYGDELYLNDPAKGIFIFDLFGGYKKTLALKHISDFLIEGNDLLYFKDHQLKTYNMLTPSDNVIATFDSTITSVKKCKDQFILLKGKSLEKQPVR